MKISTKGRYGTTAMLDLALHYGEGPVLVRDIARRQNISERYLEHLLISLKVAGMVRSTRGRRGGFTLARSPAHVRLSEIMQAMEGSLAPAECVDNPQAYPQTALCAIYDLWAEMKTALDRILESTTLEALAERQKRKWSLKQSTGDIGDTQTGG